jgi:uncharacterized membrane protein YidH (DUF202 family)
MIQPAKAPRVYLAVERTLLAWIRTGLDMMGFGFVVARFGLFLRTAGPNRTDRDFCTSSDRDWKTERNLGKTPKRPLTLMVKIGQARD